MRLSRAGFVLPTVVLVLLVMSLVVFALIWRTSERATQVIGERQQVVIYNAASPAIDRAKAKLEYLFKGDSRLPSGIPPESILTSMMLNDGTNNVTALASDPYTLPGETRLDLNGDATADNAWSFQINANGGAADTTVVYSILWKTPSSTDPQLQDTSTNATQSRAKLLEVRTAPLSGQQLPQFCLKGVQQGGALLTGQGWFDNNTFETKNFQIDAFVLPMNQTSGTASTLELEQDRQINKGNTWGAWFRYDLEAFPGAVQNFNWNGAMHTEGNLMLTTDNNNFNAYLISSPHSCLYSQLGSQITAGQPNPTNNPNINGGVDFHGQIVSGSMKHNALYGNGQAPLGGNNLNGDGGNGDSSNFHLFNGQGTQPITSGSPGTSSNVILQPGDGSTSGTGVSTHSIQNTFYPADVALDPVALFTQNLSQARQTDKTNKNTENSSWDSESFNQYKRIFRQSTPIPYVDDTYRADNRYGPKPTYGQSAQLQIPGKIGQAIKSSDPNLNAQTYQQLTSNTPVGNDPTNLGLDGYWERRARNEGLRIIVGQRLELGNAFGWGDSGNASGNGNNDPLYPPSYTITNEARQRRSQRDNLAAVQATAIYHYSQNSDLVRSDGSKNGYFPIACLATTVHPGTPTTIANSNSSGTPNFFIGQSTNGVEYTPPSGGSETAFATAIDSHSGALWHALNNLAYFAGDPNGGAPSYTPVQDAPGGNIHPYPYLSMWGDFSNLRQVLNTLQSGTQYINLSIADQAYLHTAACTLGMLAANIKYLQTYNYSTDPNFSSLTTQLSNISLPTGTPPEAYIQNITGAGTIQLAKSIMVYLQIQRDCTYGFLPSPGTYTPSFPTNIFGNLTSAQITALSKLSLNQPKYPSLFYLFPFTSHNYNAGQPGTETYISATYIGTTQGSYQYQVLSPTDISSISLNTQNQLPAVGFTENAFFNGREMLSTRVMDLDLGVLRQNKPAGSSDTWLPTSGIIYAFREDAVREDSIVRPAGNSMCLNPSQGCANPPTDPTLSGNYISTKPVDYYADPERRPYGFRLKNGATVARVGISATNNIHGLSFISDNAVYIQGDSTGGFNYHSTDGTPNNLIEEFKELLNQSDWSNFYSRKTLDSRFAQPTTDSWRPVEILADAVSILSNSFVEGSIQDGIAGSGSATSYSNQNNIQSNNPGNYWIHENPYDSNTPITISQQGNPMYCTTTSVPCPSANVTEYQQYNNFTQGRSLITPTQTRINATIISAIVPSQAGQSYGGLHNFPRFLENWGGGSSGINLYISGSFLQLNFATSATAPYDQDAWEPPSSPDLANEYHSFYGAPNRFWGYDAGLQYAPAGPVAQRFISIGNNRSEFYQEPQVNDPYILRLRCAKTVPVSSTTQRIDPKVNDVICF